MSRWNSYFNTGKKIVEAYDGKIPLSTWLKDFYRLNKQMGSRDRKIVSELVYSFYRLGHSSQFISIDDKLLLGLFVSNENSNELLANLKPGWNELITSNIGAKQQLLSLEELQWDPLAIFPWGEELSDGIEKNEFNLSHLRQPGLFLRMRPGKAGLVKDKLFNAGIAFTEPLENCLSLANSTKIDQLLKIDEEVVVQDFNSQRVGDFFQLNAPGKTSTWDCCAGSGGKSIMAYDLNPSLDLYVSDARASIIENLRQRFRRAGINNYHSFVSDLITSGGQSADKQFDYIIADVPCSGSGTWSRTPEQLYFFDDRKIDYYSELQKKIVSHVIPRLRSGGRLTYITCSVFKKENEGVIEFIKSNFDVVVESNELLKGYNKQADSLFAATLVKG